jgi:hypothetical protein
MDDGSRNKGYYHIATCCFTIEEHDNLKLIFKNKFDIDINIYLNKRDYLSINIPAKNNSNKKFKMLIEPYIIESMKYKL